MAEMREEMAMQITIPNDGSNQFESYADRLKRRTETVIVERLRATLDEPIHALPLDEQAELAALRSLSTDALIAIASEQLQPAVQQRLDELMRQNSLGKISAAELSELEVIVERVDRLTLRKAEAMSLLQERGVAFGLRRSA